MPPKAKYTKSQITDTAFNMVRENGLSTLTARSLAKALGTSTGPIFTVFDTVSEIQDAVIEKAKLLYNSYLKSGLTQPIPFKGVGMKYIQFAKDEPEFYKLLFMTGDGTEQITNFLPAYEDNTSEVLDLIESSYKIDKEKAKSLYNHLSVYAYGYAALFAQGIHIFTMEDIDKMMSELFKALIRSYL